jgi:hypothetical protein
MGDTVTVQHCVIWSYSGSNDSQNAYDALSAHEWKSHTAFRAGVVVNTAAQEKFSKGSTHELW